MLRSCGKSLARESSLITHKFQSFLFLYSGLLLFGELLVVLVLWHVWLFFWSAAIEFTNLDHYRITKTISVRLIQMASYICHQLLISLA